MKIRPKYILMIVALIGIVLFGACRTKYKPMLNSDSGVQLKSISIIQAQTEARSAGKPLFVFIHASWCPTCKKMEHEVLVEKQVGDTYNSKFINAAIDIDSEDGKKLKELYPIRATPTLFFFKADGTLAKKWEGYATLEKLVSLSAEIN